ncbi:MAG: hypothetical protein AAFV72_05620 [Cyanobacteria bacterium J06635_1]
MTRTVQQFVIFGKQTMDDLFETTCPCPIADIADGPSLSYSQAELTLRFVDYTETPRKVVFDDVVFFTLSSIEADSRELWDDRTYIVKNSSLIQRLAETEDVESPEDYAHRIICFNKTGEYLEIVYRKMNMDAA